MENEEKKKGCCGSASCECGGSWKKCCLIKIIIGVVVAIVIFCLGSQWGEMKSGYRGGERFEKGRMMNFGCDRLENKFNTDQQKATGEVTVDIEETPKQ